MGTMIELNDTLRISKEQGFPEILDIEKHQTTPFSIDDVDGKVFTFSGKSKIRNFQAPPRSNFLGRRFRRKVAILGTLLHTQPEHRLRETGNVWDLQNYSPEYARGDETNV